VWHAFSRDLTVSPVQPAFIRNGKNHSCLCPPSQSWGNEDIAKFQASKGAHNELTRLDQNRSPGQKQRKLFYSISISFRERFWEQFSQTIIYSGTPIQINLLPNREVVINLLHGSNRPSERRKSPQRGPGTEPRWGSGIKALKARDKCARWLTETKENTKQTNTWVYLCNAEVNRKSVSTTTGNTHPCPHPLAMPLSPKLKQFFARSGKVVRRSPGLSSCFVGSILAIPLKCFLCGTKYDPFTRVSKLLVSTPRGVSWYGGHH